MHVPLRSSHVKHEFNATQIAMLRWIAEGNPGADATNGQRLTARALSTLRLVKVKGRPCWHAELTQPWHHYLTHDEYPPGHFGPEPKSPPKAETPADPPQTSRRRKAKAPVQEQVVVDLTVDSPAGKRKRGGRPLGDAP